MTHDLGRREFAATRRHSRLGAAMAILTGSVALASDDECPTAFNSDSVSSTPGAVDVYPADLDGENAHHRRRPQRADSLTSPPQPLSLAIGAFLVAVSVPGNLRR